MKKDLRFEYGMLARLESDCKYFLGYGGRNERHLWAGSVDKQIEEMKRRYNWFKDEDKPEWINLEIIEDYYRQMKEEQ